MSKFGGIMGYNNIPVFESDKVKEILCKKCKQAELCDLTDEYKGMKYLKTGTCRLFIKKKGVL